MTLLRSSHPAPGAARDHHASDDVSLLAIGRLVLRHRRLVFGLGMGTAVIIAAITLIWPRTYTATTSFIPQNTNSAASRLSGVAAQFGFTMPVAEPATSPAFYASLLKSNDILRQVVLTPHEVMVNGQPTKGTLVDFFKAKGHNPEQRRDDAIKSLLKDMAITNGRETGIVSVEVTTPFPQLSQAVAQQLIQLVSEFNQQRRQTNAGAERRFIEGRLRETRDSLQGAQANLQSFLQRNRDYRNAPQLTFEYDRLQREVQQRQDVYNTLMQSYEQARIDEVRNTPMLTIVEYPDLPSRPDPRWALVKTALGLMVGILLGAVLAAFWEMRAAALSSS